ncbi:MAG: uracil-DNA glycosylase, partial [Planctomycetes bacterium]|nr:uracil-DNA glycosylase [Planctomycetota bacterium]
ELKTFLVEEKQRHTVFPPGKLMFNAFWKTPFDQVKVVVLGQDPYHGVGQAHGLSFSVPEGVAQPPSLKNILQEIQNDIGGELPKHGCLESWAEQGVFLLNTVLSVRAHQAFSHAGKGWEIFTDAVITALSKEREGLVFLLWGGNARKKASMIDKDKHLVLEAPHPSPLSVYRGFWGCKHFSKANDYLKKSQQSPVDWLPKV